MMKIPDKCSGCLKPFGIEQSVYEHHAMGVICKACMKFASALDAEVARLRVVAERWADIEASWVPTRKAGVN